ncbi:sialidase family protein [Cyclobacterium xiamenense]|uniref:sialidase family protein n=1 Tax=Cyclobacterium xiamenense TaxID=1297121 RepID=UPI0012B9BF95|nr:sialidase family protein [Cyclobacterium xiamenense]
MKPKITAAFFLSGLFYVIFPSLAQENRAYLQAPEVYLKGSYAPRHQPDQRRFSGIPSLALTGDGQQMWSVWYAGPSPGEDENNYVVLAHSKDAGNSWEELLVIDPDGPGAVRAFDPEIWMDPTGRLWVFWAQTIGMDGTEAGVWAMTADLDSEGGATWSTPQRLTDGIMMCKPTVLRTGEWALPASTWRLTDNSARMVVSADRGKTWQLKGAIHVPPANRVYDEHQFVEKKDGRIWALLRTNYGIGESYSTDQGARWSPVQPSLFAHPSARFFIRRLHSGNLLLVKHGPLTQRTGRSHLMAFVSRDDGLTWSRGLLLDQRPGVSYPDGQQAEDGTIHLVYDRDRTGEREIVQVSFREADIWDSAHDEALYRVFTSRKIISSKSKTE